MSDFLLAHEIAQYLSALLDANSNGKFSTIGFRQINFSEEGALTPIVTVLVDEGKFNHKKGSRIDNIPHTCIIKIIIIASASAQVDLSVISNENSTDQDRANAMLNAIKAGKLADEKILKTIRILFDIILAAENYSLGYPADNVIGSKDLIGYKVIEEIENGSMVTKKAVMSLAISVIEHVQGIVGIPIETPGIHGEVQNYNDSSQTEHIDEHVDSQ